MKKALKSQQKWGTRAAGGFLAAALLVGPAFAAPAPGGYAASRLENSLAYGTAEDTAAKRLTPAFYVAEADTASKTIEELQADAKKGDAEAQNELGDRYYYGEGVEQDYEQAVEWYQKAANQGYAAAQFSLARCCHKGEGMPENHEQEIEWLRKAANQGYAKAQASLGYRYKHVDDIHDVLQDNEQAIEWTRKAADQGNIDAQYNLGVYYYNGDGVDQDYKQAAEWFRKAAEQGDAAAQYMLGLCYYYGCGVDQDYKQAVEWFQKSAEQGYVDAQYYLGWCYEYRQGVDQDYKQAAEWYRKAADQGHADSQNHLGELYYYGRGVEQDYKQAAEWYRKAAEQGSAEAQWRLGNCYYYGRGVEQNYEQAAEWYRKSAEQGYVDAQYYLGWCYEYGQGVDQDYKQAMKWYRKAALQGHDDAKEKIASYTPSNPFVDVYEGDYYYAPVLWASGFDIVMGTEPDTFSPYNTCTQAQILTFIWRAAGEPEPTIANPFSNVEPENYYYKAVLWAYGKGIISGNSFDAYTPCTRSMAVSYLWKDAGSPAAETPAQFTDVSASDAQAVSWAVENGITFGTGDGTTFSPDKICTRGDIVTFLYRYTD